MKYGLINLIICFVVSVVIAPYIIRWLHKIKFGQNILIYVEKHKTKAGTPTMGGIIFIVSAVIGYFIFFGKENTFATISILSLLFFGIVGFLDDYIKVKYHQNEGLKPYQKIVGQLGISIAIALFVYFSKMNGGLISIPFSDATIDIGFWIIPFVIFVYLAVVNGVNLIDGLDGLCAGVSSVVIIVLTVIFFLISRNWSGALYSEMEHLNIVSMGVVGGLLGFLCYNGYPAKVFMGDTGSLAIGGYLASMVVLTQNYLLICIVGIAYVLTVLSVIIQVSYYKLTHKRIFKMAPLHHHFEQYCNENKVVTIYIIVTLIIGILTITLYL